MKTRKRQFTFGFISPPTEKALQHWLEEARRRGISDARFQTMWFKACRDFEQDLASRNFKKRSLKMAELLIEKGRTPQERNVGREFLNESSEAASREHGVKFPILSLEEDI